MNTLEIEDRAFQEHLPELLKGCDGQWAVVKGPQVSKVLPTYEDAVEWAYGSFGLTGFMVRQVRAEQPKVYFTRHFAA